MDGQDADLSTGLSNAVTRDGQSPATANIPMGGFKQTGVAAASSATEYLRADQYQKNDLAFVVAGGTIDAWTATPAPAIAAYTAGLRLWIKFPSANISTTPTLNVSGLGTGTITKNGGQALAAADISANNIIAVICTTTSGANFELGQIVTPAYTLPAAVQQWDDLGTKTANYSFGGTSDAKLQMYCNTTSGFVLTLPKNAAHGRLLLLVKAGAYTLNLCGTINNASGTIQINGRGTLPMTYNTTEGWL